MRFEDFPFISDPKTGLVCSCVPVTLETEELTRAVRTFYVERVTQFGYTGFSWEIDDICHQALATMPSSREPGEPTVSTT